MRPYYEPSVRGCVLFFAHVDTFLRRGADRRAAASDAGASAFSADDNPNASAVLGLGVCGGSPSRFIEEFTERRFPAMISAISARLRKTPEDAAAFAAAAAAAGCPEGVVGYFRPPAASPPRAPAPAPVEPASPAGGGGDYPRKCPLTPETLSQLQALSPISAPRSPGA